MPVRCGAAGQTNLSNFTGTTYRNVSRSYVEFQQFHEAIVQNNLQTITPALPLARTSAPTDEEDDRLVKIMLQRWFARVCKAPILVHEEDGGTVKPEDVPAVKGASLKFEGAGGDVSFDEIKVRLLCSDVGWMCAGF